MEMSIIVPTCNGERILPTCLFSILEQNFPNSKYEVIVIDDFSNDGTLDILKEFSLRYKNFRYFKNTKKGAGTARNLGISFARGKYLGFIDQDMVVEPDWIRKMCFYYENHPYISGIGGLTINARPNNVFSRVAQDLANNHFVTSLTLVTNNCSYKKEAIDKAGQFSEEVIKGNEDAELSCRIFKSGYKTFRNMPIYAKHYQISTLRGFLRQAFFYGYTDYWCKRKHADIFRTGTIVDYMHFSLKRIRPNFFLIHLDKTNKFNLIDVQLRLIYILLYGFGAFVSITHNIISKNYPAYVG